MKSSILAFGWVLAAGMMSSPCAVAEDVQAEVSAAFDKLRAIYAEDFDVQIVSPELKQMFETLVAGRSPLPVTVDKMFVQMRNGRFAYRATVAGVPPAFQQRAQAMLDAEMKRSALVRILSKASFSVLRTSTDILASNPDYDVIRSSEKILDIEVNNISEPFLDGARVIAMRARIDRTLGLPILVGLYFPEERFMMATAEYAPLTVPHSGERIDYPIKHMITHRGHWRGMPPRFSLHFHDYQFIAPKKPTAGS